MELDNIYKTVHKFGKDTIIINKSRFIGYATPIESEKDALDFIDRIKTEHRDATHNVYAYVLGENNNVQKFSDDGEPSGTAGKPVLEVIKSTDVKNVLIVVTRYFGGIHLGASGLIRAYSESASRGLKNSKIVKKIKCDVFEITTDYNMLGKLQWELNQKDLIIKDIKYAEDVKMEINVPKNYPIDIWQFILDLTSGNADVKLVGSEYIVK